MFTAHSGLCSTYVSVNPFSHSRVPSVCMLLLLVANGRLKALCMWAPGQALPEHLLLQLPSALSSLRKDGCGAGWGGEEDQVPLIPGGESLAGSSLSARCGCPPLRPTQLSRPGLSIPHPPPHLPRVHLKNSSPVAGDPEDFAMLLSATGGRHHHTAGALRAQGAE